LVETTRGRQPNPKRDVGRKNYYVVERTRTSSLETFVLSMIPRCASNRLLLIYSSVLSVIQKAGGSQQIETERLEW
jgi:hypothetical protein